MSFFKRLRNRYVQNKLDQSGDGRGDGKREEARFDRAIRGVARIVARLGDEFTRHFPEVRPATVSDERLAYRDEEGNGIAFLIGPRKRRDRRWVRVDCDTVVDQVSRTSRGLSIPLESLEIDVLRTFVEGRFASFVNRMVQPAPTRR